MISQELKTKPGTVSPLGPSIQEGGLNFSVYIKNASEVILRIFYAPDSLDRFQDFHLDPLLHRTGNVWHLFIEGISLPILYSYQVAFFSDKSSFIELLDPYAKEIASHFPWKERGENGYRPLARISAPSSFDWQEDKFPRLPNKDLIIYEMHTRGFTQDPSSHTQFPGTYLGMIEKIPYLKELGINCVELLPIHEFNETEALQKDPMTQMPLCNYFGYSTVNFFSPMARYAKNPGDCVNEFKTMVRELHKNGIEVILDVVYNHTFEGGENGIKKCYKGLDQDAYYMKNKEGQYLNFSGCGNTFNVNHPVTSDLIMDSLRYWVTEMHVDGFRFDLASIFSRGEDGTPLASAPIIERITKDPVLADTKLIAEAWDAAGLYQVGGFYPGQRWSEWNGRYRDVVRRFIKGTPGNKTVFATALSGSEDLYGWRGSPLCSVNFVTAHDGFSLHDLVSYNEKHNEGNGEDNKDGFDHNESWNCGIEGHSNNKKILQLREQQMKNLMLALFVSQGIPMILMGDEYAHTRKGNNNTWCQDNQLNWFLWKELDQKKSFFRFYRSLIHFRKSTPLIGRENFLNSQAVVWHGSQPMQPEWDKEDGLVAFSLNDEKEKPHLYIAFNASGVAQSITFPLLEEGLRWQWIVNTSHYSPDDFYEEGNRPAVDSPVYKMPPYSSLLLKACLK